MDDAEKDAIAVRKNMACLRELRLANEAQAIRERISNGSFASPKSKSVSDKSHPRQSGPSALDLAGAVKSPADQKSRRQFSASGQVSIVCL
jgi:hypothetical protein